jgi:hydroxymethylpyrimidine pyrophosphatase-like HAD family hydrolase
VIRAVYTDLDVTLLGRGASLFRDAEGNFSMLPARALEACHRTGAEVVIKSGRRKAQVMEDARLLGQTSYIYEVGCGVHIDGEETYLTGDLQPGERTVHQQIEDSGAPALLLERFAGRLEYHDPWHRDREFSHLMRGVIDVDDANALLPDNLRLVDNGAISPKPTLEGIPHAYHLIPAVSSKAAAVAFHMRARGYAPDEVIGVGDSREDLGVAEHVGRFFLVGDADLSLPANAQRAESFYEAVIFAMAT